MYLFVTCILVCYLYDLWLACLKLAWSHTWLPECPCNELNTFVQCVPRLHGAWRHFKWFEPWLFIWFESRCLVIFNLSRLKLIFLEKVLYIATHWTFCLLQKMCFVLFSFRKLTIFLLLSLEIFFSPSKLSRGNCFDFLSFWYSHLSLSQVSLTFHFSPLFPAFNAMLRYIVINGMF